MKLVIESDGTPAGTYLRTEDGFAIEGVQSIVWKLNVLEGFADVQLTMKKIPLTAVGETHE